MESPHAHFPRLYQSLIIFICCYLSLTGVAAQTQILAAYTYASPGSNPATCTGAMNYTSTYLAGQCINTVGTDTSTAFYCSSDGQYVYVYSYSSNGCGTSSLSGISQIPTICGWMATGYRYTCLNLPAGPSPPLLFPPAGWGLGTSCFNISNRSIPPSICDAGSTSDPNIRCLQSASQISGSCRKSTIPGTGSYISGCTADRSNFAVIYFSDSSCQNRISASLSPTGRCVYGSRSTCGLGSPIIPYSMLPNKGITYYDNDHCASSSTWNPVMTLFYDTCFISQMFSCFTNEIGVTYGTLKSFSDSSGQGQCLSTSPFYSETQWAGLCVSRRVFTCPVNGRLGSTGGTPYTSSGGHSSYSGGGGGSSGGGGGYISNSGSYSGSNGYASSTGGNGNQHVIPSSGNTDGAATAEHAGLSSSTGSSSELADFNFSSSATSIVSIGQGIWISFAAAFSIVTVNLL